MVAVDVDETGPLSWNTDAYGQKNQQIAMLNKQVWSMRDADFTTENGVTNRNGEAELQSLMNDWQCEFEFER